MTFDPVTIPSRPRHVRTGLRLTPGRYRFTASGHWQDAGRDCDANGYASDNAVLRASEWLRRVRDAPWFALIGRVGKEPPFVIGTSAIAPVETEGELVCFANDVWLMYFNNRGAVSLRVVRLP